uniref:hypothetical protein n=1 Tax=uncultured Thiodictyon sp. TaxID=1846217 RepID=UPI0025E7F55D
MLLPPYPLDQQPAVRPLTNPNEWTAFFNYIREHLRGASPRHDKSPLNSIVEVLNTHACSCVVVEHLYEDEHALYDYLHDHARAFCDMERRCLRAHFFAGPPLTCEALTSELLQDWSEGAAGERKYLGYVVFRATGQHCVGRTVIRSPANLGPNFEVISSPFTARLCGAKLHVPGTPFMESDLSSHVCAGAALWMLCEDLHHRYRTRRLFPRQVTEIATGDLSLRTGLEYLTQPQMARVLRHLNCSVHQKYWRQESEPDDEIRRVRDMANFVCGYVQSGIPVLIGYCAVGDKFGHVVLAVGHGLADKKAWPLLTHKDAAIDPRELVSDYVQDLLVHNDSRGPYRRLPIWRSAGASLSRSAKDAGWTLQDASYVHAMAAVAAPARMVYEHALAVALRTFLLNADPTRELGNARLRTYLQLAPRFRELLLDTGRGRTPMSPRHTDVYLRMTLPRYIYVCDICRESTDVGRPLRAVGEIVIDGTSPPFDLNDNSNLPAAVLTLRLGRRLWVRGTAQPILADAYPEHP